MHTTAGTPNLAVLRKPTKAGRYLPSCECWRAVSTMASRVAVGANAWSRAIAIVRQASGLSDRSASSWQVAITEAAVPSAVA